MGHRSGELHLSVGLACREEGLNWPDAEPWSADRYQLAYYLQAAQWAERGLLDALVLEGALQWEGGLATSGLEPMTLAAALAASARRIGLVAAIASSDYEPYHVARGLASLDRISQGRSGWLLMAPNAGSDPVGRTDELLTVVRKLWDSWQDDAVVIDRIAGVYARQDRVKPIDHRGAHYQVKGPLNVTRPVQGHPVVIHAVHDEASARLAARHADWALMSAPDCEHAIGQYEAMKRAVSQAGRDPEQFRISHRLVVHLDSVGDVTPSDDNRQAGWHYSGSSARLANQMAHWAQQGATDGFYLSMSNISRELPLFVEETLPRLRAAGLARQAYTGNTLRSHLGLSRPPGPDFSKEVSG